MLTSLLAPSSQKIHCPSPQPSLCPKCFFNPHHNPLSCFIVCLKIRLPSLRWLILPLHKLKENTTDMAHHMVCQLFPKGWGFLEITTQPGPNLFFHIIIDLSKQEIQPGMKLVEMLEFHASTSRNQECSNNVL